MEEDKIELKVADLSGSMSQANAYALLLREIGGKRQLPIIIGNIEAQAIAFEVKGLKPPRPFTHDLFVAFADMFCIDLMEVVIYKVLDGIFYSYLYFELDNKTYRLDSRTSDAVALALRFQSPIYTTEAILQSDGIIIEEEKEKADASVSITAIGIEGLKEALEQAVADEDYELASRLRDEIKRREEKREKKENI